LKVSVTILVKTFVEKSRDFMYDGFTPHFGVTNLQTRDFSSLIETTSPSFPLVMTT